jgi:hypothetical protein
MAFSMSTRLLLSTSVLAVLNIEAIWMVTSLVRGTCLDDLYTTSVASRDTSKKTEPPIEADLESLQERLDQAVEERKLPPKPQKRKSLLLDSKSVQPIPSRIWPIWEGPFPCFPGKSTQLFQEKPSSTGLIYLQSNVVEESPLLAGIALRISHRRARDEPFNACKLQFGHQWNSQRNEHQSFAFAFVGDPAQRATTSFYRHMISELRNEPRDLLFQSYCRGIGAGDFFLYNVAARQWNVTAGDKEEDVVDKILSSIDFVGVEERLDESLVVLKLLLGLDLKDILYIFNHVQTGYFLGKKGKCYYSIPPYVSPSMKQWFENAPLWRKRVSGEELLHKAAMNSLDRTIQALGPEVVQQELGAFVRLQELAVETCAAFVELPCDVNGAQSWDSLSSCRYLEMDCGYKCLDLLQPEDELVLSKR